MKKKQVKEASILKASDEFVVGKHGIGWVDSDFKSEFYGKEFLPSTLGKFQKLGKYMSNADEIEKELKPGKCTLGDVYAFLHNPPKGCDDGWANLFLIENKVVSVDWRSAYGYWGVCTWSRGDDWRVGRRVFSPGLGSQPLNPSELTLILDDAIEMVKKAGYQVSKLL